MFGPGECLLTATAGGAGPSVVPHGLHEAHSPVLVSLYDDEADQDVPHAVRDWMAAVEYAARVRAHVPALDCERSAEALEPRTAALVLFDVIERNVE
eukprot:CAMPEP_0183382854 /NCGR_PEP_ID=MMETSP0164_2-20130417/127155_1 /TAXON_ID=221442 /ORGANISM="Coccolithus pelagicus ssp braarudi, Strain PLY182g" /LENGTH=96 /DNA_ID=CAMNT_0025560479 /DNA_START=253 /DNA_END=542 /DNA_ORIENTATION=+